MYFLIFYGIINLIQALVKRGTSMCKKGKEFAEQSVTYVKRYFHTYLEKRDFAAAIEMLDKDASWNGVWPQESVNSFENERDYFAQEEKVYKVKFKITEQKYQSMVSQDICIVIGQFTIIEDAENDGTEEETTLCASVVCHKKDGKIKILHIHASILTAAETIGELVYKSLTETDVQLLEDTLVKRTKELSNKSKSLEILTNNIMGGIEICVFDTGFPMLYVSNGLVELTGYSREELMVIKYHNDLIVLDDSAEVEIEIHNQLRHGDTFTVEYRIQKKNGEIIWVLDRGTLIKNKGEEVKVQCLLVDITKQKEIEIQLKISEKRYEIAVEYAGITMYEYNVVTNELILIDSDAQIFGTQKIIPNGPETLVETGVVDAEYAEEFLEMYRRIKSGALYAECFIESTDVNGEMHDLLIHLVNIFDDTGRPVRAVGVRKDITQERKLQREQQYSNALTSDQKFRYEANVTSNTIIKVDDEWAQEVGADDCKTFIELKELIANKIVSPDYCKVLDETLTEEALEREYKSGARLVHMEYRKRVASGEYRWFRNNINIIKDSFSGQLIIRCYVVDIHDSKMRQMTHEADKRLYNTIIAKTSIVYEINITRDVFISGQEKLASEYNIACSSSYSDMLEEAEKKAIYPEDRDACTKAFSRINMLKEYGYGKSIIALDYRRANKRGDFEWVRCTMHMSADSVSGDVVGRLYLEDINEAKTKEIALIYKSEHDELTGLYNKTTVEKKIQSFLDTSDGKAGTHAFFILDIDYFKMVNDNFGHAFGDVTLSQVATKLSESFRDGDILGRIGGDEFVVFMKNISVKKTAHTKAKELCDKIKDNLAKDGLRINLSISIGIAFYGEHGRSYDELYKHSDIALYVSKEGGRNIYTVYNENMNAPITNVKAIDENLYLEPRSYEDNIAQYVFRILYEVEDKASAIHSVLELMGKQFNTCRTYIFEYSEDGKYLSNTFEWCREGVSSQIKNLQNIPFEVLGDYGENFNKDGIFFMPDATKAEPKIRTILEPQGTKSMLQFSITRNGKFVGFIGFDECRMLRVPTKLEVSVLQNVSNVLAVFILEMRSSIKNATTQNAIMSIINGLDSYAYVCDPDTHKILFLNERTHEIAPKVKIGDLCYKTLWNRDAPCDLCPMATMIDNKVKKSVMEMHNTNLNVWVSASSSWIDWVDGRKVCLVDSIDITKYK